MYYIMFVSQQKCYICIASCLYYIMFVSHQKLMSPCGRSGYYPPLTLCTSSPPLCILTRWPPQPPAIRPSPFPPPHGSSYLQYSLTHHRRVKRAHHNHSSVIFRLLNLQSWQAYFSLFNFSSGKFFVPIFFC